jgi:branched-chain amino acid transport system substrate-binding protein
VHTSAQSLATKKINGRSDLREEHVTQRTLSAGAASVIAAALLSLPAFAEEPIKIGSSLPLTGNFAVTGKKHQEGFELCVKLIKANGGLLGRKIELIVSDNRSDTETALNQYERLINVDGAQITFGTFSSKLTFPVSALLARNNRIHPVPSGGALRIWTQGHKNMFYFQQNAAEYTGETLTGAITKLVPAANRPKTAALVHADDFFANGIRAGLLGETVKMPGSGKLVADMAPGFLAKAGIKTVYKETWPEEGFSDWLNLANSIKRSGAELVIGLTASAEEAVQLTRALKTVKAQPKMIYLSQGTQSEYEEGLGADSEAVLIHTSWHADVPFKGLLNGKEFTNKDFQAAFKKQFGRDADEDSAIPFAVCQGVEQAVRAVKTTDNAKLGEWLSARTPQNPVKTVLGNFAWDKRGLPIDRPFLLAQWQGRKLKFVYPTGEFEGVSKLVYPKPQW